jgi:hypothetical protein
MTNQIHTVTIDRLAAHPDNPNRMSKANFTKLVRNIKRTGRYEPLVVRPKGDCFQVINGHHRLQALQKLGFKTAEVVIWEVDDNETDMLLASLNRLTGSDELDKKLILFKRLNDRLQAGELAKLLPQSAKQIEQLANLKMPTEPARLIDHSFAKPLVFFLSSQQQEIVDNAISITQQGQDPGAKAQAKAAAIAYIAQCFIDSRDKIEQC